MGATFVDKEEDKWWNASTVAIVTGANKGIGFEAAKALREQGLTVVVAARNEQLGLKAQAQLEAVQGAGKVVFHQLDITDAASIDGFASWIKSTYPQGFDILLNNAGFAYKGSTFGAAEAQATLDVNYFGTAAVTRALSPMLHDQRGRIVTISSRAGSTRIVPSRALLATIESADERELDALAAKFVSDIAAGSHEREGWPSSMYGVSKLFLSMSTRLTAKELEPRGIMVNACCPGWCQTDMSSHRGPNTAAQGADTPVWLALRPPSKFETGHFFGERTDLPF